MDFIFPSFHSGNSILRSSFIQEFRYACCSCFHKKVESVCGKTKFSLLCEEIVLLTLVCVLSSLSSIKFIACHIYTVVSEDMRQINKNTIFRISSSTLKWKINLFFNQTV